MIENVIPPTAYMQLGLYIFDDNISKLKEI